MRFINKFMPGFLTIAVFLFSELIFCKPGYCGEFKKDKKLGSIIVTAQKVEENIQEVPVAVTVFDEISIDDFKIENVDDVIDFVPNMTFDASYAQGSNVSSIRGLKSSTFTGKNPVVIFIDGIAQDNSADYGLDLMNIERIEVLRGAQGTLYGKNAIGGVINIISKKPGNEIDSKIQFEAAEDETYRVKSYINGPIIKDKLFFGLSQNYLKTDGYMENDYPGEDKVNDEESIAVSSRLRWKPSEKIDLNFHSSLSHTESGTGTAVNGETGEVKYHELRNPNDEMDYDSYRAALNISYDGGFAQLNSITTFSFYEENMNHDNFYLGKWKPTAYSDYFYRTLSQEIRIESKENDSGVKWVGGFYYSFEDTRREEIAYEYDTRPMFGYKTYYNWPDDTNESVYAVFGQMTYPLSSKLDFTGGLRCEYSEKEMDYVYELTRSDTGQILGSDPYNPTAETNVEYNIDDSWSVLLPKAILSWRENEDMMFFASISKGYLAGGFNLCENIKDKAKFDEQTSIDYEFGIKTSWFDKRLIFNSTFFYLDIDDMHVYYAPDGRTYITSNAGKASSKGVEIEFMARPLKGLDIIASYGLTHAEYDEYENTRGVDCSGKDIPSSPDYTLNLAAQYRNHHGFFCRLGMQGFGRTYFDEANSVYQESYQIYNAKIGYESSKWDIYLYGKNIFDEEYFSFGTVMATGIKANVGEPQTFGVVASFRF